MYISHSILKKTKHCYEAYRSPRNSVLSSTSSLTYPPFQITSSDGDHQDNQINIRIYLNVFSNDYLLAVRMFILKVIFSITIYIHIISLFFNWQSYYFIFCLYYMYPATANLTHYTFNALGMVKCSLLVALLNVSP